MSRRIKVGQEQELIPEDADGANLGGVRALERGLRVLRCFDVNHRSYKISDLSRASGLHRATTWRLVKTLEAEGFLAMDSESGSYHLGSSLLPLAYVIRSSDELVRMARPHMERIASSTGETVGLSVWTVSGPLLVDHIPTTHFFKPSMLTGRIDATYGSTHTKIFLAFGSEERLSRVTSDESYLSLSLAQATGLHEELDTVRKTGIAYDLEETREGVCALGVPVRDDSGEVVASLSIVVPKDRFGATARTQFSAVLTGAAQQLSRELGFRG